MSAKFEAALNNTLRHEGGYVNDPVDPGGATNYGISLRFLRNVGDLDLGDVDHDGDIDADDIRLFSREHAASAYRAQFWDKCGYEAIKDALIAAKVFDMAVNMGPRQAHKILQRALNDLGCSLVVDGDLGPLTLGAVNNVEGLRLFPRIVVRAKGFYLGLMLRNPALKKYKNGWFKRAEA